MMLKNISKIKGVKKLKKSSQKNIYGGFDVDELCPRPNAFFCAVDIPDHVCCNGFCVLPSHPACGGLFF